MGAWLFLLTLIPVAQLLDLLLTGNPSVSMELSSQLYEVARSADELEEQRRLGRDASTLLLVEQLQSQTDSLPHATLS
jgi:hypothetical protein